MTKFIIITLLSGVVLAATLFVAFILFIVGADQQKEDDAP